MLPITDLVDRIQKEKFWTDFLAQTKEDKRIKYFGWVDSKDPKYLQILYASDFIVFPSLGEGQPGTVTEAMEAGCLPLVSKEAGIDYSTYPYERGNEAVFKLAHALTDEKFASEQKIIQMGLTFTYNNEKFVRDVREKLEELL